MAARGDDAGMLTRVGTPTGRRRTGAAPPEPVTRSRVLVVAQAHARLSTGGAELAAWRLFQGLRARGDVTVRYLACGHDRVPRRTGAVITQPFGPDEYIYAAGHSDYVRFANRDPDFPAAFAELLRAEAPDIVHFHHYVTLGPEALAIARRALPHATLLLTLHEFAAICHNHGQMVTRPDMRLCDRAEDTACARCFPELTPADFFLRRRFLMPFLALADGLIAPSAFVAGRYIDWGLPAERMTVIPNVPGPVRAAPVLAAGAPGAEPGGGLALGFFGQFAPFKGLGVLIEAARMLDRAGVTDVRFAIHGTDANQNNSFRRQSAALLAEPPPGVTVHGPYANDRVHDLMRAMHAVVVPSVWWENAPLVIEEAIQARRPVLCGNIGGMAEAVRDGQDGYHFVAGSAASLAGLIMRLRADPGLLERVAGTQRPPADPDTVLGQHLDLYRRLRTTAA